MPRLVKIRDVHYSSPRGRVVFQMKDLSRLKRLTDLLKVTELAIVRARTGADIRQAQGSYFYPELCCVN